MIEFCSFKKRTYILFYLIIIFIIYFQIFFSFECIGEYSSIKDNSQINNYNMRIYNINGSIKYKIFAQNIIISSNQEEIFITNPIVIIFNENKIPIWSIDSMQAKISKKENYLFLYGKTIIKNFIYSLYIKKIYTNNAILNLKTHDIFSRKKTILFGSNFNSTGIRMQGNLKYKIFLLKDNITTLNENQ
ncbi:yrbK [Wigglesworthia glossinidia endosymbiont of Glossina brevipalpis]|uniref:Lipopolysaccharide export system protein LptC n=1 Tax=Wigglesworthia glossinidia brevipalpis TaxID=36870 RepID=Q8D2M9_WIGBR|nr:yrbK [Wigglesworthia glossinidia endosymbiont of Glossina brevipalpis]